jgi:hypothetical protein
MALDHFAIVVLGEGSGLSIRTRWVRVPSMAPSFGSPSRAPFCELSTESQGCKWVDMAVVWPIAKKDTVVTGFVFFGRVAAKRILKRLLLPERPVAGILDV